MQSSRQHRLATAPIGSLLWQFSMPAIIGMLVQSLYNIIDTVFVGHAVGALGIAALSIVFPIQMLITAITQIISVGCGSLVSIALGAKDQRQAEAVFGNAITLALLVGIIIMSFSLIYSIPILKFFGATEKIMPFADSFFKIVAFGIPFIMFAMISNNIVRAEGNPKVAMLTMISSALINTTADALLIFGLHLGVVGAALATVIAQASIAIYLWYYFIAKKSSLKLHLQNFILKTVHVFRIIPIGSASFTRIGAASATAIIINHLLGHYGGDIAIATYGILNRIFMFILMPLIGIAQGLQPIIGYNYGAKTIDRVVKTIKLGVKVASSISFSAAIIVFFFIEPITRIFTTNSAIIALAHHAILFLSPTTALIGFQVINNNMFESLGKAKQALIVSLLRGVIFLMPTLLIASYFWHMNGIWISFPIADILSFSVVMIFFTRQMRKFRTPGTPTKLIQQNGYSIKP